jgi:PAS domain S-box-containing protein
VSKGVKRLPLRVKLVVFCTLISGGALLVANIVTVIGSIASSRTMLLESLETQARVLSDTIRSDLLFEDAESAKSSLEAMAVHTEIQVASVYGRSGYLFCSYARPGMADLVPKVPAGIGRSFGANHVAVVAPIVDERGRMGTIYLRMSIRQMWSQIWRSIWVTVAVTLGAILMASMLSARFLKMVLAPLQHLEATARYITDHKDYSARVVSQVDDDLGIVTEAFNEMLDQIQAQNDALEHSKNNLEHRVRMRTADLKAAVESAESSAVSLMESDSRTRAIMETAADAILTFDDGGVVRTFNSAAERIFGYLPDEATGMNMRILIPDVYARGLFPEHLSDGKQPNPGSIREFLGRRKNGQRFPMTLAVSYFEIDNRCVYTGIVRDITDEKSAQIEREELNRRLLETSRQAGKAEVATGVLHNVGNVLNSINVTATLLSNRLRDTKIDSLSRVVNLIQSHSEDLATFLGQDDKGKSLAPYLAKLATHMRDQHKDSVQDLADLVNHIDHIKRIVSTQQEAAKVTGVVEEARAKEMVESALQMNDTALQRHAIQVVRDYQEDVELVTDRHRVLEILINLITNAKHAMATGREEGRKLTVRVSKCAQDVDALRIDVEDNGMGIAKDTLEKIFSHGFTTKKSGHGFGLHSCALAAKDLGGSLTATSDGLGKGACFTLMLPIL